MRARSLHKRSIAVIAIALGLSLVLSACTQVFTFDPSKVDTENANGQYSTDSISHGSSGFASVIDDDLLYVYFYNNVDQSFQRFWVGSVIYPEDGTSDFDWISIRDSSLGFNPYLTEIGYSLPFKLEHGVLSFELQGEEENHTVEMRKVSESVEHPAVIDDVKGPINAG